MTLQEEITRRRTFAVIAHPDAGKTTPLRRNCCCSAAPSTWREPSRAIKSRRGDVGLHGDRTPARHLGGHLRDGLRVRGPQDQHSRHAGPRRLRRRYLPHADGRRFGHHRHRRRQGRRGPDPQADGGLPHAPNPRDRLHQQAGPSVEGALRPAGRGGEGIAYPGSAADVPDLERTHVQGRVYNLYEKKPLALHLRREAHGRRLDRRNHGPRLPRSSTSASARNTPISCDRMSS